MRNSHYLVAATSSPKLYQSCFAKENQKMFTDPNPPVLDSDHRIQNEPKTRNHLPPPIAAAGLLDPDLV